MGRFIASKLCLIVLAAGGVTALVLAHGLPSRFCIGGQFVTDDVIVSRGEMYVPVSAVARALDLRVRESGEECDLVRGSGGRDDTGQTFAAGGYRFSVVDVARVATYRAQYGTHDFSLAATPGQDLIVVTCRLWNGTGVAQSLDLTGGADTRLGDAAFHSFEPSRGGYGQLLNGRATVLAGDMLTFALKFQVPHGFRPARLVFSAQNSFDRAPLDFPVSLRRD